MENEQGRLAALCRVLADANVNMTALTVADTASFGVARLLVDEPVVAADALSQAGYRAKLVDVSAVEIPNVPGGLALLLDAFTEAGLNLEYAYCFASDKDKVVVVLKVEEPDAVAGIVGKVGYQLVDAEDM